MTSNAVQNAQLGAQKLANSASALRKANGSLENAWQWLSNAHIMAEEAKLPVFVAAGLIQAGQGEGHRIGNLIVQADMAVKELQLAVRNLQSEVKMIEGGEKAVHEDLLKWIERLAS